MACSRPYRSGNVLSLVFLAIMLLLVAFIDVAEGSHRLNARECKRRCTFRCSATSHKKPCMFFCLKCCATCKCVPPGTYGNKEKCPCYNSWKTKEGRPKCP